MLSSSSYWLPVSSMSLELLSSFLHSFSELRFLVEFSPTCWILSLFLLLSFLLFEILVLAMGSERYWLYWLQLNLSMVLGSGILGWWDLLVMKPITSSR